MHVAARMREFGLRPTWTSLHRQLVGAYVESETTSREGPAATARARIVGLPTRVGFLACYAHVERFASHRRSITSAATIFLTLPEWRRATSSHAPAGRNIRRPSITGWSRWRN